MLAVTRSAALLAAASSIATGSCSPAESGQQQGDASKASEARALPLPTGATREPSGFATILSAPSRPLPDKPPAAPPAPVDSPEYRMSMANPDATTMAEAGRIMARIRARERGNFVQVEVIRDPRPRYAITFRRDAAATLARYTRNPNFVARQGGVPRAQLEPLLTEWLAKFGPDEIASGGGAQPARGIVEIDLKASASQFAALARQRGWTVPPQVVLRFAPEVAAIAPIAREAMPFVRAFPRARYAAGIVPQILLGGRIVLRDGCLRLVDAGSDRQGLAVFARGTQVAIDAQGYLAVRSGVGAVPSTRIGERVTFGIAPAGRDDDPDIVALHAKCGPGKRVGVGLPTSAAELNAPWFLVDQYVRLRRVSRATAWDKIRACRSAGATRADAPVAGGRRIADDCDQALGNVAPPPPPAPVPPVSTHVTPGLTRG